MERETILYISDHAATSNSVLAALKSTGCQVLSTDSSTQAIAMLFVRHSVPAVVLNDRARERTNFDLARSLRAICRDVPIILLCRDQIDPLPSAVDACVSTRQPLEDLTSAVRSLLTATSVQVHSG